MIRMTKTKVKEYARLMSAEPFFPKRVSEFRKYVHK